MKKALHQRMRGARDGQAIVFVLMVLVILAFVALWQFDLHKTLFVKFKSRNAGDGAALAGARWQGVSLNLIGELNILQAVAISQSLAAGDTNFVEAKAIGDLAARVAFTGPMVGFLSSQQAAKNNGIFVDSDYTREVADHADEVRNDYPVNYPDPPYHNDPEPPTAWEDYADMIGEVASLGIAVSPDNVHYFNDYVNYEHMLLNPSFYDAIATKDWCWFYYNAYNLIQTYQSFNDWPPLPIYNEPRPANAEYCSLGLRRISRLSSFGAVTMTNTPLTPQDLVQKISELTDPPTQLTNGIINVDANWLFYSDFRWLPWTSYIGDDFPFRTEIKPEYDVLGADNAVRLGIDVDRITPGVATATVAWSAAAKPLGLLENNTRISQYGLVLPGFTDVRMIPVDASTAPLGGTRPGWGAHIHDDLPAYVAGGPGAGNPACWYCQQLVTWELAEFRTEGLDWIRDHHGECWTPPPGGGGSGGGSHRGH